MTDVELLRRHRDGDDSAFTELVRRHLTWVYGVARRQVGNSHLADDVSQAVFILLHRKAPSFTADAAMMSWMHRTARYAAANALRGERRRRAREAEVANLQSRAGARDDNEWEELAPMLDELVGRLSRADRESVLLRYYRDMSYAEVADRIGVSEDAARKRVDRAIEKLRGMASRDGIPVNSAAFALGLAGNVRVPPPPGLIASSSIIATTNIASAATAAIVHQTSVAIFSTKLSLIAAAIIGLILIVGTTAITTAWLRLNDRKVISAQPHIVVRTNRSVAAYSGIRWRGQLPQVEIRGTWYELVSFDGLPIDRIVASARSNYAALWQKRVAEDLVDVLDGMGHSVGGTAHLELRKLDNGQLIQMPSRAMTSENRAAIMGEMQAFPPIRWQGPTLQIDLGDTWYDVLAIGDVPISKLISIVQTHYPANWQANFGDRAILAVIRSTSPNQDGDLTLQLRTTDGRGETVSIIHDFAAQIFRAPFSAIRWNGDAPRVQINGVWYDLIAVDDQPANSLTSNAQKLFPGSNWRTHFGFSFLALLVYTNHWSDESIDLKLRPLDATADIVLHSVPMTFNNAFSIETKEQ